MSYIEWNCEECIQSDSCPEKGTEPCNEFLPVGNDDDIKEKK